MITSKFEGRIHLAMGQRMNIPCEVELAFDEENDPLSVQMIVTPPGEEDVVWVFGRELILRGIRSYTAFGEGDVKFRYDPRANQLLVCLKSPGGHADLGLPFEPVANFLEETIKLSAPGAEEVECHVDDLIKEILES